MAHPPRAVDWVCGGVWAALGFCVALLKLPVAVGAFAGVLTEAVFAAVIFFSPRHTARQP